MQPCRDLPGQHTPAIPPCRELVGRGKGFERGFPSQIQYPSDWEIQPIGFHHSSIFTAHQRTWLFDCVFVLAFTYKSRIEPPNPNRRPVNGYRSSRIYVIGYFTSMSAMLIRFGIRRPDGQPSQQTGGSSEPSQPQIPLPIYPYGYEEDEKTSSAKARSISRCSDLLRQKYELDIRISACGKSRNAERPALQRKSDALFREIQRNVHHWKSSFGIKWTVEEWDQLEQISKIIDKQQHHS